MLSEMIAYHLYSVVVLGLIIFTNMILPWMLKQNISKLILWTRIGYFAFWMFWAIVLFSGLILFMFTGRELTFAVWMMIVASFALPLLDGYRAINIKKLWMSGHEAGKFSTYILIVEIIILLLVAILAVQ